MLQFLSSGTRRGDGVKDPAQSTTLVDNLNDVVRSTGLWTKLYAGQVLDTFGVGAISHMPVAIEYLVTGSAIVFGEQKRQIAVLLGDARDVLAAAEPLQIVKINQRDRCECIDDVHLQVVAEEEGCVSAGGRPGTECLPDTRQLFTASPQARDDGVNIRDLRVQACLVKEAVIIFEQNQIVMDQSSLAKDRQRLDSQPSRHSVEDIIQLARVLSLPHNQGAIGILLDVPTQLAVISPRAIPRRHELKEEAFDGSTSRREIVIDPVRVAATEQVFDGSHATSPNAPAPSKNRAPCFAGARASIGPRRPHKRWIASG